MHITVVGSGYVGLVTGACLAEMGHTVVCVERERERLARLGRGEIPFHEPGLAELVVRHARTERLRFTDRLATGLAASRVVFVAVGTPSRADGSADLTQVFAVADELGSTLEHAPLIAIKSTVPVGTSAAVHTRIAGTLARRGVDLQVNVVSNPEFLKEGSAVLDFMKPDRIVIGADAPGAASLLEEIYAPFVRNGHPVLVMDTRSSEMTKYAANVMLAARISMVNELAALAAALGADITDVRRGIGADPRIGMQYLYPGLGYGGSCLPKDVRALVASADTAGMTLAMLPAIEQTNRAQLDAMMGLVVDELGPELSGRTLALWGLAFKPNTDDIREAPAIRLAERLLAAGASVRAFDPEALTNAARHFAGAPRFMAVADMMTALDGCDGVIVGTEWPVFRAPDLAAMKTRLRRPVVFDGRHLYSSPTLAAHGLRHRPLVRHLALASRPAGE